MKKIILLFFLTQASAFANSNLRLLKISYLKNTFGHIHQNASRSSTSLTTLSCGHPIKVYEVTNKAGQKFTTFASGFFYVSAGNYYGYIQSSFLVDKKPNCFQKKYPKFFDALSLEITDFYYWGRLYDQYSQGKSTVK